MFCTTFHSELCGSYFEIFPNKLIKENLYSEYLNIEGARNIVSHCIKKTFEEIKSRVKNNG